MIACDTSLLELERLWGGGKLSNEELIGCLLRYLAKQERAKQEPVGKNQEPVGKNQEPRTKNQEPAAGYGVSCLSEDPDAEQFKTQHSQLNAPGGEELKTQNSKLKTPSVVLGSLLRQIGDVLDALTGQQLELWHVEGLWYWRWEDTEELARCGLASYGEALVDAVERRYPDELLPAVLRAG